MWLLSLRHAEVYGGSPSHLPLVLRCLSCDLIGVEDWSDLAASDYQRYNLKVSNRVNG